MSMGAELLLQKTQNKYSKPEQKIKPLKGQSLEKFGEIRSWNGTVV
jgi:hypothetical protein